MPNSNVSSGVPLLEVVTEPDLRSGAEAAAYGAELRKVVTFLGISNGNMQAILEACSCGSAAL